jgi:hypothetical protein
VKGGANLCGSRLQHAARMPASHTTLGTKRAPLQLAVAITRPTRQCVGRPRLDEVGETWIALGAAR